MAKEVNTGKIPNIETSWEGYAGSSVEAFIKEQLSLPHSKIGWLAISDDIDAKNFYHLYTFDSEESYNEWVASGKDPNSDFIKQDIEIPISTAKEGRTYVATLRSTLSPTANIVVTDNSLEVELNYRSIIVDAAISQQINAGIKGIIEVQRKTTGNWEVVGTLDEELDSKDNYDSYVTVDIGKYLAQGKQELRLQARYSYITDDTNEQKVVRSNAVLIGSTVTLTALTLELNTDFHIPMEAFEREEDGGGKKDFRVDYTMYGDCDKTLNVIVEGSIKNEDDTYKSKTITTTNPTISLQEESAYGFLEHGVRKVTAWITAPDGLGGTLESNKLVNSFMVVNKKSGNYDASKKYLLIQNRLEEVTNFIQSKLLEYAVYSENSSDVTELKFSIKSTGEDIYNEIITVAESNKPYSLTTTIEIESNEAEVPEDYKTRMFIYRDGNTNFIEESDIHMDSFFAINVDNSEAILPLPGATFLLNPKNRNNDVDPFKIYNAANINSNVEATFENFGLVNDLWTVDEEKRKCLRVLAGQRIVIERNFFDSLMKNPNSTITFDIDFRVRNITNTEDPILTISGGGNKGLTLNPLTGWIRTKSYNNSDNTMFSWREGKRQFLSVNIDNNVKPKKVGVNDVIFQEDDKEKAEGSLALARVLLNGDPVREIPFNTEDNGEWCDSESSIIIGSTGADIDIYSIRLYEGNNARNINWIDLLNKNYISSLPTTEEKKAMKRKNDLYDVNEGRITLQKALDAKLNCIVYHGQRPYVYDKSEDHAGYIEYYRFDLNGNALPEYSGKNCEGTKSLKWKAQGSTAKTYYEHNMQDDNSKIKKNINVAVKDFHDSIQVRIEGDKAYICGGNLGKNFPLEMAESAYDYDASSDTVSVPDGWIDGNGKYRGMGYMVAEGTALAQKKVAKINYASAMQSHLLAACKSYDELHYAVVGATPMQQQAIDKGNPRPVSAKHTEPFLMFWEQGDGVVYYTGLCVYGAGKMDKVAWGYTKKKHENFSLIEGSDNNLPMTDFRVPFDKNTAVYDCGEEYWAYITTDSDGNEVLEGSLDFDGGMTVGYKSEEEGDDSIEAQMAEGWKFKFTGINPEEYKDEAEAPSAKVRDQWALKHNFIYLNSSNIKYFNGTIKEFKNSSAANDTSHKYWCTVKDDEGSIPLLRYDYYSREWVNAGLYDEETKSYKKVDLSTDLRTKATFNTYYSGTNYNYDKLNEGFKSDMAAFMKKYGNLFINLKSLTFNYAYVLSFLAGTDNSSKNTYFKTDPIPQDMSDKQSDEFDGWFADNFGGSFNYKEVYQLFLDGDDMDSILPVNNKGNMTKPYYIERKYPYREGDNESLYEGMENQLFNFIEIAYTDEECANTLYAIFKATNTLVDDNDIILGSIDTKISIWGFLHKYFFNVQYYFPQIAYIEQARIRYEFAHLVGNPGAARGVTPISQSIGSQIENEQQFMEQRVVYMASFAGYGSLGNFHAGGSIGIEDTGAQLSFQGYGTETNPQTISFELRPYQYIYPYGVNGQTIKPTFKRVSPHETCKITLAEGVKGTTDTSLYLNGINYYTSIGNIGDTAIYSNNFTVVGKRLKEFIAEPKGDSSPLKLEMITMNAPLVERFVMKNCNNVLKKDGSPLDIIDLKALTRCNSIDLSGTRVKEVVIPSSFLLTDVKLGSDIVKFKVEETPNLSLLQFDSIDNIRQLIIGRNHGKFDSTSLMSAFKLQQIPLDLVMLEDINWTIPISMMMWMTEIKNISVIGNISIEDTSSSPAVTFEYKNLINQKWGDVDHADSEEHKGLLLNYRQRSVGEGTVKGVYFNEVEYHPFSVFTESAYDNKFTKIVWSVVPIGSPSSSFEIDSVTGVLRTWNISKTPTKITISATIYDGKDVVKEFSKELEFYDKPAKVGDIVFYDGTYCSLDEYDNIEKNKTAIGLCVFVAPRDEQGNIVTELFNENDKQTRLMIPLSVPNVYSDKATAYSVMKQLWGCYSSLDSNGINVPVNGKNTLCRIVGDPIGNTSFLYDIQSIRNLTSENLSLASATGIRSSETQLNVYNEGFKLYDAKNTSGDGFAYNEPSLYVEERTLTESLSKLAGDSYKEGDVVNSGYAKTLKVIEHRNRVLTEGIIAEGLTNPIFTRKDKPTARDGKSEIVSLANLLDDVNDWAKNEYGDTTNPSRWKQIYYPLASFAYAYEPSVDVNEVLPEKFKAHNWFVVPFGLLARIWWFYTYGGDEYNIMNARRKGILTYNLNGFNSTCITEVNSISLPGFNAMGANYISNKAGQFTSFIVCAF